MFPASSSTGCEPPQILGRFGDGIKDEEGSEIPAIVSRTQLEKVQGYIVAVIDEGAVADAGAVERDGGFYARPTLFSGMQARR